MLTFILSLLPLLGADVPPPPNIIIILADDISWDDIGCYGNDHVSSPNMDGMARDGMLFTNAFVTTSSCSPSRCSILSGRYPHNTGAAELHTALPGHLPTIAGELRKAGYFTAQSGKWHMGNVAKSGFDAVHDDKELMGDSGADHWLTLLRQRPANKPFFLWLAALDAHRPWGPNDFSGRHHPDSLSIPLPLSDTPDTRADLAAYYDEISRLDDHIGRVKEELMRQGILENTFIVIMADNGRPFPGAKTTLTDRGIKTQGNRI